MKKELGSARAVFLGVSRLVFAAFAVSGLLRNPHEQPGWLALLGIALSFLPALLRKTWRLRLPLGYEVASVLFIFLTLVLGEYYDLYGKIWWWDDVLHFVSGLLIGYIGLLALYMSDKRRKVMSAPWLAGLVTFSVAVASAAVWEMFEFSVDRLAHGHMQYGLVDTMVDIIDASIGAVFMGVAAYWQYVYPQAGTLRALLESFARLNSRALKTERIEEK